MAVGSTELPTMLPIAGVRLASVSAGIKKPGRDDVVLIELAESTRCAAAFTQNAFCAAPVVIAKQHLNAGAPRYLLINTGNANAGTGNAGLQAAQQSCHSLAQVAGCRDNQVLPFSTGVIGEALPVEKIEAVLPEAVAKLDEQGWKEAAWGILTTDTVAKGASFEVEVDGHAVTITGVSKGSGMIRPDMATMLAYIATDAAIAPPLLAQCLKQLLDRSFNRITVDGDTSTNDACLLIATGSSTLPELSDENDPRYKTLLSALSAVFETLAQKIVRDGEGATKLITVDVLEAASDAEAQAVAYTVAHSPLVKTAFFASDPNWGRILAAVGRAGVEALVLERVEIYLGDLCIVKGGGRAESYREALGQQVMKADEITITIKLARGAVNCTVWTCDFSYDYVKINAEYRT
ncbi:MAG: bifunctional glutamate N-acetyltransferase/amino-acid acetyltransferase ArgJ [Gammaproteobacteria bacterium]|nr:bifunctional glutamate N-acetyltransferase/amino-acid acetyltransferase ArgJ [Gammaproteobacteria bacterium]